MLLRLDVLFEIVKGVKEVFVVWGSLLFIIKEEKFFNIVSNYEKINIINGVKCFFFVSIFDKVVYGSGRFFYFLCGLIEDFFIILIGIFNGKNRSF